MSKNGQNNISAVEKFVKFLYQPKWIQQLAVNASVIPTSNLDKLDLSSASTLFQYAVGSLPKTVSYVQMPDDNVPGSVIDALDPATALAFTPGKSDKDVCSAIDAIYSSNAS